jgi:hypothetical protein
MPEDKIEKDIEKREKQKAIPLPLKVKPKRYWPYCIFSIKL